MTARLNQHQGGDWIDIRTHRCSVLPPLTDEQHDDRLRWAEHQRLAAEHANAPWKWCDLFCIVVAIGAIGAAITGVI
jgi:hypothetical protein